MNDLSIIDISGGNASCSSCSQMFPERLVLIVDCMDGASTQKKYADFSACSIANNYFNAEIDFSGAGGDTLAKSLPPGKTEQCLRSIAGNDLIPDDVFDQEKAEIGIQFIISYHIYIHILCYTL